MQGSAGQLEKLLPELGFEGKHHGNKHTEGGKKNECHHEADDEIRIVAMTPTVSGILCKGTVHIHCRLWVCDGSFTDDL